ncbi:basic proline-rich protein-like [Rousettus aegyptiacus]|uniref:basic proline-rich protein-like n=1 Tax=Rousettus aegyptiacus TaxID=9407 RepID=UPI00168D93C1|nr:basic proline-rich protein-like [Rousettus aegyptiacus]
MRGKTPRESPRARMCRPTYSTHARGSTGGKSSRSGLLGALRPRSPLCHPTESRLRLAWRLGLGAPRQARNASEPLVRRGRGQQEMRARKGGGRPETRFPREAGAVSPGGTGETRDEKQGPRSLARGVCPRHRRPLPARGPRLTEPRGPAAPPRPRCAPLAAPCLPSAGAGPAALSSAASSSSSSSSSPPSTARTASLAPGSPGQPRGLGRTPPAPAPHPAWPPVRLGGGDAGLRAAASLSPPPTRTTLVRPSGVRPGPRSSGCEPLTRRLGPPPPRPRPAASARPPEPAACRASASSAPPPPAPRRPQRGEEARRCGRGHEHARGGRAQRARGRGQRGRAQALPAVVPGAHVHCGGAQGLAWSSSGTEMLLWRFGRGPLLWLLHYAAVQK